METQALTEFAKALKELPTQAMWLIGVAVAAWLIVTGVRAWWVFRTRAASEARIEAREQRLVAALRELENRINTAYETIVQQNTAALARVAAVMNGCQQRRKSDTTITAATDHKHEQRTSGDELNTEETARPVRRQHPRGEMGFEAVALEIGGPGQ